MWMTQPQSFQVGPNGAVNLDQPVMMPYGAYSPAQAIASDTAPVLTTQPGLYPGEIDCSTQPPYYAVPCPPPVPQTPMLRVVPTPLVQQVPCPPPVVPQAPCPPPPKRWSVFGEALWLHPTGADVAHAQQQEGIGGAGTAPLGLIDVADPDYDLGFRVGGEFQFEPCAALFGSYTFFEESTTSVAVPPVIPAGVGAVRSLVHHPGPAVTASVGPVTANYDLEFQLGDLAYRRYLLLDNCRELSVFGGGRFGQLDQSFLQTGLFSGGSGGQIDTTSDIEFTGGGPMAGIDAEHRLDATGFSVYGRALVAALTGQFDNHYRMFNTSTGTLLAEAIWEDDRIVPMLDYELGLAWTSPNSHFRFAVGYLATHWFNAVTTPVFIDAVQADNYTDVGDTISFDGLVGHAEFRW
jgi:hypothetical protein